MREVHRLMSLEDTKHLKEHRMTANNGKRKNEIERISQKEKKLHIFSSNAVKMI